MGKSIKKSATKVDVAPVAVTQSGKKGKRGAENEIEKALSAKKQKVERNETVIAKQKAEKKIVKKAASSSSEEDSDSDSDSEPEVAVKKTTAPAKNGSAVAKKPTAESSSESSSDSDSEDEKPAAKKGPAAVKNGSVAAKKTAAADSSDSSSDDESDDEKPAAAVKNVASKKPASSSDEDDSDSSEDEEPKKVAAQPKKDQKKPAESSDSDDDSSDEEDVAKAAPVAAPKGDVDSDSSDNEEDSSDSDEEPKATKQKVQAATKSDSSDEDDESSSDEEEDNLKTPKKKDTDVEMVDPQKSAASTFQKTPKTPATSEATGSKTLFAGNLAFSIEENDVREFFKGAGEVIDVRFAVDQDGKFKGFGHVEFATAEAAQKALEMNQQDLLGRPVRLDLAHERGASQSRDNNSSFQKGGRTQGSTAFIRGFNTSLGEDDIRSALQEHFGPCGESTRISIPPDHETGGVKGMAYIDFVDSKSLNAALELDGSDLGGGYILNVQEAKPRGDSSGGGRGGRGFGGGRGYGGGRDSGGRFSGGRGGRDGGRGGRFSGGRGGRDGGRGGRTPFRSSVPSGKKTTFGDD